MKKLSQGKLITYSIGEVGFILAVNSFDTYITYFLTDVALMTPLVMAIVLFVSRIGDFISVPLTGILVEKTNLKSGKLRPWLAICPPLMFIVILICFSNPTGMSIALRGIIIVIAYTAYGFIKNTLYTAYLALPTTMTKESDGRMNLSVRRSQFNATAKILQSLTAMPLILAIGNGNEAKGYFWMMTIMAMALVAFFMITFLSSKEDPEILKNYESQGRATIKEMLVQAVKNKPLLAITVSELTRWLHLFFMYSLSAHYFKYIAEDMSQITYFFLGINICLLLGTAIGQFISKKLHSRRTYNIGMLILGVMTIAAFFVSNYPLLFTILLAGSNIGFGFSNCVIISMFNDSATYGEWKMGKNISGFVTSFYSIAIILASVINSPIIGAGLHLSGYEANAALTPAISFSIRSMLTLVPGIIVLLGIIVSKLGYKLGKDDVARMQAEIDSRN